jgi:hypothetical protein
MIGQWEIQTYYDNISARLTVHHSTGLPADFSWGTREAAGLGQPCHQ